MIDRDRRNRAIEFHNQAHQLVATDKQMAYRLLCSAVTVDPTMAVGWHFLSGATADLKLVAASVACLRRALALPDGEYQGDMTPFLRAKCMVDLGHRLFQLGQIDEAAQVAEGAIVSLCHMPGVDPEGEPFAFTSRSLIRSLECDTATALIDAKTGYDLSVAVNGGVAAPIVETGLGFAYLFAGEYAQGLKHFEARFAYRLPQYLSYPYPRWDGGEVGTLFIAADQGLGDSISFARFVPLAAKAVGSGKVLFQVQGEILRMMVEAMKAWPNVEVIPQSTQFPIADVWCPVFSLPVALGLTTEQIRDCPQAWAVPTTSNPTPDGWKSPGAKLHVGIAWAGSADNDIDMWRSVEFARFLELYQVPGIALYSLQVGYRQPELHSVGAAGLVRDMAPYIKDASDTAAIIRDLDLVITVESFLGHLTAALDAECWVLVSRRGGDWRIGRTGDKALWYPRTRLFRQHDDMEWGPVFKDLVEALKERVL